MGRIEQVFTIHAPVQRVWQLFTDPRLIRKWSDAPAAMSEDEGARFELWDGDIFGTNTQVITHKLLEQDWYGDKSWVAPSKVSFSFGGNGGTTLVRLVHEEVPDADLAAIEQGWQDYYMGPLGRLAETSSET
jgi:uncharacterized protein YndB with AHSA1/START domain